MELAVSRGTIRFSKELNRLDTFTIDFVRVLDVQKIKYVLVSGYVAILFGRSRNSEDIDLVLENLSEKRWKLLWLGLTEKFVCLNTNDPKEAYHEYLRSMTAVRFSRPGEYVPNIEVKFVHQPLEKTALERRVKVVLNEHILFVSPIEQQIAFKLFLGSEKDIEDAKHLHLVFREYLNKELLQQYINALHQEATARKYLDS